jgi:hypothetical protein
LAHVDLKDYLALLARLGHKVLLVLKVYQGERVKLVHQGKQVHQEEVSQMVI